MSRWESFLSRLYHGWTSYHDRVMMLLWSSSAMTSPRLFWTWLVLSLRSGMTQFKMFKRPQISIFSSYSCIVEVHLLYMLRIGERCWGVPKYWAIMLKSYQRISSNKFDIQSQRIQTKLYKKMQSTCRSNTDIRGINFKDIDVCFCICTLNLIRIQMLVKMV